MTRSNTRPITCPLLLVLGATLIGPWAPPLARAELPPGDSGVAADPAEGWWTSAHFDPRYAHVAVYDPIHNRTIVIGGLIGVEQTNEVWLLTPDSDPVWRQVPISGPQPTPRGEASAIYDPIRDRVILYGGVVDTSWVFLKDTWALSLSGTPAWTQLGDASPERAGHIAVYDPLRHRMVVYGGRRLTFPPRLECQADVVALDLSSMAWSAINAGPGPPTNCSPFGFHDPERDRLVVYNSVSQATWAFDFASQGWSEIVTIGTPPSAREYPATAYDPAEDRLLLFGGYRPYPSSYSMDDTWELALSSGSPSWSQLAPSGATPRARHSAASVYDSHRRRWILVGGVEEDRRLSSVSPVFQILNDTRALSLDGPLVWSALALPGLPPAGASDFAFHDLLRDRIMLVTGAESATSHNELWAFSQQGLPSWGRLDSIGPTPSRQGVTVTYDAKRDRILLFGGASVGGPVVYLNDVWEYSLVLPTGWTPVGTSGTGPTPRAFSVAIYDPAGDRMILCGGQNESGRYNEVWQLSLDGTPTWTPILFGTVLGSNRNELGAPPSIDWKVALYDAPRERLVAVLQDDVNFTTGPQVWALSLTGTPAWSHLADPFTIVNRSMAFDRARDRLVIMEIAHRALPLADPTNWVRFQTLNPAQRPRPFGGAPAVYDARRDRMWMRWGARTYALEWGQVSGVADRFEPAAQALEVDGPRPNPAYAWSEIDFRLSHAGVTRVEVWDVSGRRVASILRPGWRPAGVYRARWDGRDATGSTVGAGVYFIRVQSGSWSASRKLLLLP